MVIVFLSIKLLIRRTHQHKVNIAYSLVMLAVATTWFILTTRENEIELIEAQYHQSYEFNLYCSATNIGSGALSSVIIVGSDILLVRVMIFLNIKRY
jgi:hypothetical protein